MFLFCKITVYQTVVDDTTDAIRGFQRGKRRKSWVLEIRSAFLFGRLGSPRTIRKVLGGSLGTFLPHKKVPPPAGTGTLGSAASSQKSLSIRGQSKRKCVNHVALDMIAATTFVQKEKGVLHRKATRPFAGTPGETRTHYLALRRYRWKR